MKVNKTTEATNLLLSFCYINLLILTKHTQKTNMPTYIIQNIMSNFAAAITS